MDINALMDFARDKHAGQKRKNGEDYIIHPLKVALMLSDAKLGEDAITAGLFHDLLEDTDTTEEEILAVSNERVLEAVKLVTKTEGYDPEEYINRILSNPIAKAVKNADRIQNLQDALNADEKFARGYAENTKKYYVGRFSEELDRCYEELCERLG